MNLNKVFILGRLTANPQLRSTPTGQAVATFSIATSRFWKDKSGGRQEKTEYHNIVAWGRQAEVANQFLIKGSLAFVEGRMETRSWQDKQGQDRKTTEIICDRLQLGPRPGGAPAGDSGGRGFPMSEKASGGVAPEVAPALDDIPVIDIEEEVKPDDLPF